MNDNQQVKPSTADVVIRKFESAWKSGSASSISAFVPPESRDDTDLLTELACIDLENRLKRGNETRVEFYTAEFPQLANDELVLLELVRTECAFRSDRAELDVAEYTARFPALAAHLEMMFQLEFNRSGVVHVQHTKADWQCTACGASVKGSGAGSTTCAECDQPIAIGRYQLLERIGEGAFGFVFRARDPKLDRIVALKVPRSQRFLMPEESERFLRESRNAAQLDHPGIVRIFDAGRVENTPYIVSEFVDGQTLAERTQNREFNFQDATAAVLQIANAVTHAHERGVVHRDLKPANVMTNVSPGGELIFRVMDFGLARREQTDVTVTAEGQAVGTPAYMSPEQARGDSAEVGPISDVYSLGVILFKLLCGELPFRGSSQMLMQQVINDDPPSPSRFNNRIPRDLETVCLKAISREPAGRYQSSAEFAADLQRWLDGKPVLTRRVGTLGKTWRWCKRRPAVAALLVGLTLSLVAGVTGITWQWQKAEAARRASEADLADALESVDRVLGHLGSDTLANVPQAKQLRAEVLNDALEFFERFRKRNPNDPRIAMQVAQSHAQVARIRNALGDTDQAREAYENAVSGFEKLKSVAPDRKQWLYRTAGAHSSYAWFLHRRNDQTAAVGQMKKCIELRKQLHDQWPETGKYAARYATSRGDFANMLSSADWKTAETEFDAAVAQLEALSADHKTAVGYKRDLGRVLHNYAIRLAAKGQYGRAETYRDRAIDLYEQVITTDSESESDRAMYANACLAMVKSLGREARMDAAEAYEVKAISAYRRLSEDFPATPRHRERFAALLAEVGGRAEKRHQSDKALNAFEQEVRQRETLDAMFPGNRSYSSKLAAALGSFADLLADSGRKSDAEKRLRQRLAIRRDLARDSTSLRTRVYHSMAARSLADLIRKSSSSKKRAEADKLLTEAADAAQGLTAEQIMKADLSTSSRLSVLRSLVTLAKSTGDTAELKACYAAKGEIYQRQHEEKPESLTRMSRLAMNCYYLSQTMKRQPEHADECMQLLQQAVDLDERLLKANPDSATYQRQVINHSMALGMALMSTGETTEAIVVLSRSLELAEQSADELKTEGFRTATTSVTYWLLASALSKDGQYQRADKAYQQAITLSDALRDEPGMSASQLAIYNAYAWFCVECPDDRFRDYEKARDLARKTLATNSENGSAHGTLGFVHLFTGKFEQAIASLQTGSDLTPNTKPLNTLGIAMAHFHLDDPKAARASLNAAEKAHSQNPKEPELFQKYHDVATQLISN